MNEKEAVEKTIVMWIWLRGNPTKTKDDYFEMLGVAEKDIPRHECYLCRIWRACYNGCPLGTELLCCHNDQAPYGFWHDAVYGTEEELQDPDESPKQAQRIINACKRWLKKRE